MEKAKKPIYIYYYRDAKGMFTGKWVLRMKTDSPDTGFIRKNLDDYSKFKTVYHAPEIGYTNMLKFVSERTAEKILINTKLKDDEYIIFKVQNSTNSTMYNYGKIYQPFTYGWNRRHEKYMIHFTYYYNPVPDDRNLEFDPKQNIIKILDKRGKDISHGFAP